MAATDIVAAYQARYGALRGQVGRTVGALWDRYGGLTDEDLAAFVAATVPVVQGAQLAADRLVQGFTSVLLVDATGRPLAPVEQLSDTDLRGVPAFEVYRRPVVEARTAISLGHVFDEAMRFGRTRATVLAQTDVMLAQRSAMDRIVRTEQRIVGYRRVLTGESCELCQVAATNWYKVGNLMPIHDRCDCSVSPIMSGPGGDPGDDINSELIDIIIPGAVDRISGQRRRSSEGRRLETARRRVRELSDELRRGIPDQERETRVEKRLDRWIEEVRHREARMGRPVSSRVAIRQHGELGPVLTQRGHAFTGPQDI